MKTTICNISVYKISFKRLMLPNKDVTVCLEWRGETQALNFSLQKASW